MLFGTGSCFSGHDCWQFDRFRLLKDLGLTSDASEQFFIFIYLKLVLQLDGQPPRMRGETSLRHPAFFSLGLKPFFEAFFDERVEVHNRQGVGVLILSKLVIMKVRNGLAKDIFYLFQSLGELIVGKLYFIGTMGLEYFNNLMPCKVVPLNVEFFQHQCEVLQVHAALLVLVE